MNGLNWSAAETELAFERKSINYIPRQAQVNIVARAKVSKSRHKHPHHHHSIIMRIFQSVTYIFKGNRISAAGPVQSSPLAIFFHNTGWDDHG